MSTQWMGVDISKDTLSIAWEASEGWGERVIENSVKEISSWIKGLDSNRVHIVLEHTGTYGHKLMWLLHHWGITFSAITPRQSRQFSGVLNSITKNDAQDAKLLALFGRQIQPQACQIPSAELDRLDQLRTVLRQLKKQRRMLLNQQHALQQRLAPHEVAEESLANVIREVEKNLGRVEKEIFKLAEDQFNDLLKRAISVKGIGKTIATALLIATNGLADFNSPKELAKFAGLAPSQFHSGTSVRGQGKISDNCDKGLRSLIYMGTLSAVKSNKACKALYNRLREKGKPEKVARVAVAHKLLRQVWAVVKHGTLFDNNFEQRQHCA